MTTMDIVVALRKSMDSQYIFENDDKVIHLMHCAANKLEELQRFVDEILGDHYFDYLEFYATRCMELEEMLEKGGEIDENGKN